MKKTILDRPTLADFARKANTLPELFNAPTAGLAGVTAKQYVRCGFLRVVGSEPYTFTAPDGEKHESTRNLYTLGYNGKAATVAHDLLNATTTRRTAEGNIIYYVAE